MPETNKIKKEEVKVDLDTSGPEVDVDLPEEKEEKVVETGTTEQEQETVKEVVEEKVKEETKKEDDEKLEDYSKGVQSRIAKLTRKMREAERREQAAVEYAQAVEKKRQADQERFQKVDSDLQKNLRKTLKLEWIQRKKNLQWQLNLVMQQLKLKLTKELQH